MYDLLLKNAHVVDPKNGVDGRYDVAIEHGKIAEVVPDIVAERARRIFDIAGNIVMPGLIDPHVHVSGEVGGREGYAMMAKAGVITAVDFAGPVEDIVEGMKEKGSGMNIAVLHAFVPEKNISGVNPPRQEIEDVLDEVLAQGALGVKILGGHYPFTPDASASIIDCANQRRAYMAFHVGTTECRGDLHGFREAIELIGDHAAHVAHINSYCRGIVKDPVDEIMEVFSLLEGKDRLVSESYLAQINGTSGKCSQGEPESNATKNSLLLGGLPATTEGLRQAILKGFVLVNATRNGENVLVDGEAGVEAWNKAQTDITVSFRINDPQVQFLCATRKDKTKNFLITALSTDGGGIPRNVTVEKGLLLVKLGALSLEEFVVKSSLNPARMFGMVNKGHLSAGADADITVLDLQKGRATMGICGGNVIMAGGVVLGTKGTLLTTARGIDASQQYGLPFQEIDLEQSLLYLN